MAVVPRLRVDPWGHFHCLQPGQCAEKGWADCDDGIVCTADSCDPKVGCVHTTPKGMRCAPNNDCSEEAFCLGKICQNSANGAVYVKRTVNTYYFMGMERIYNLQTDG